MPRIGTDASRGTSPRHRSTVPAGQDATEAGPAVPSHSEVVVDLAAWRQRRAWAQAVLWLHDHGLPAAVPYDVGGWLRAHGIEADWYHRAPCHPCGCGDDGCYVLAADGERPPPEIHLCPRWPGAS